MMAAFGRSPASQGRAAAADAVEPVSAVSSKASIPNAGEGVCEICRRQYRIWSAASPLWNAVCRGGSINGEEEFSFLCANCFMELAEDRGIAPLFRLTSGRSIDLEYTTPDGRHWNNELFLFEHVPTGPKEVLDGR